MICMMDCILTTKNMQPIFEREYGKKWIDTMNVIFNAYGSCGYLCGFYGFVQNPNIYPEYVLQNPDLPWNWWGLCGNPNVDLDFILQNNPDISGRWWCYYEFVCVDAFATPYIKTATIDEINKCALSKWWYPLRNVCRRGKPWNINWHHLSKNKYITFDIVLKHRKKLWDWFELSRHPNITFEMIMANPDLPWNWNLICMNPNITMEIIAQNPDKPWNWKHISANPNLDVNLLITKPHNLFDWNEICKNPAITLDFVLQHPELPLTDWFYLNATVDIMQKFGKNPSNNLHKFAQNPNLTLDFLLKNSTNATYLMYFAIRNPMTIDKNNYVEIQCMRFILATIYEFYQMPTNYQTNYMLTCVERVFADDYLVKMIFCNFL